MSLRGVVRNLAPSPHDSSSSATYTYYYIGIHAVTSYPRMLSKFSMKFCPFPLGEPIGPTYPVNISEKRQTVLVLNLRKNEINQHFF